MHPNLLEDLVAVVSAADEDSVLRAEWVSLAGVPGTLRRSGVPAHFTASALVTTADGARVCLVLHRRIGMWVQPGGHFEPEDRSVAAAARREMIEETGLSGEMDARALLLSRHPSPCGVGEWHLDVQMLAVVHPLSPVVSEESEDVAWFDTHDLPPDLAPGVGDLVDRAAIRLRRNELREPRWPPG